ncbi:RICIN domain-containing protein [Glycomyces luteolus]|uniref:RICIN domain-containing protein n=1 Tax=Glycomyces luteolus TaxID=2670330 RepID=A0A9X3SNS4_9ACTN|nr:RICIN domain-containing protein [Glycomyces luteolus]MDA1358542.1 RICIN domain-containing protein [Glycomyces luteolus]
MTNPHGNPFSAKLSRRNLGLLAGLGAGAAAGGFLGAGAAHAAFTPGTWYVLQSRLSGLVWDLSASTANGAKLVQQARTDTNHQQFRFVDVGGGYYKIQARHSNLVLDVYAKSKDNGADIVQWADNGGVNQHWQILDDGTYLRFVNRNSGKALDVWERSTAPGSRISQYDSNGGTNQQFRALPAGTPAQGNPTIYIASDSTAQNYNSDRYPMAGWGQKLGGYFDANTTIANHAIGGRSSRSFIEQGRLQAILDVIKPDDYLYVQFGHNDASVDNPERYTSPADYKMYLRDHYMAGARAKGAIPVLLTPVNRLDYNSSTGRFNESFATYAAKVHELVSETGVALIDLGARSRTYLNSIGYDRARWEVFMHLRAGQYPNYPNGLTDSTHFQDNGANQMARLVAEGTKALPLPIAGHVR